MDWLTYVEKDLMAPPPAPSRSFTGGSQRSYSTYSNPSAPISPRAVSVCSDDTGALTGVSAVSGRSGRSVVTKIGPDLIQRLQGGYLEVSLSTLGPEGVRSLAAQLLKHPRHLYCLKLKLTNVKMDRGKKHKTGRSERQAAEEQARRVVGASLADPEVNKAIGAALVHLLDVTTQLQLLEVSLSPGMALAQRLSEGLRLNSTLRCVSFKSSAMGDAVFATVAAGLQHATSLEVLLLQGCNLTDRCFPWINLLLKFQGTQRTDLQWQSTLRADTPQRSPAPFEHSSSGFLTRSAQGGEAAPLSGLIKLDLSDNTQLTVDGVRTLAVTLSRMNNRVAYLGLRRNRLARATTELMRELLAETIHLRVVDLRGNAAAGNVVRRDAD